MMTISASGLKVGAGTFFSSCARSARGAAFAVLGLVAFAGASTHAVAASVTDWASRAITISPAVDRTGTVGSRTKLHYAFTPDAASRLAWTNDSPATFLTGFENPNRKDYFTVALPKGASAKTPPAGCGLVVQLHGRNGGEPGDASESVIGNVNSADSVFYAPDDCYALNLDCLENVFSDFWYGSHPPAETVLKGSIDHMTRAGFDYQALGMRVVNSNDEADYNNTVNTYEQYIFKQYGMQGEMFQGPKNGPYATYSRRSEMSCIKWNTIHESAVVKKLMDTIEWVVRTYKIDRNRIYLTGNSMGGQAALALGLTHGEVFAAVNANVPATIWFAAARLGLVNEDGSDKPLADVRQPGCDPPPVFDWSGSDDEWSRRHDVIYRNADRMRFAYTGWWGDYGHVSSVATARSKNDLVLVGVDFFAIRKDAPYAVFTESSCNTDLPWPEKDVRSSDVAGTPPPVIVEGVEKTSGYLARREGTPAIGQWNAFLKGEVKEDSATQFAADIWIPGADELPTAKFERPSSATANVSFRRIQNFPHGAGAKARWSFGGGSGVMTLDRCGLFTLEQVQITGQKQRLTLTATTDALTPAASFTVPAVATSGQFGKATVALNVTDMAGSDSFDYVIEKSESADFASSETVALGTVSGPGRVTRDISGFEKGKSYCLRARLDAGSGAGTTLVTSFTTRDASRAKVTPPKIAAQTYTGSPLTAAVPSDARWRVVSNPPVTAAGTHAVRLELTEPDANQWSVDPVNDAIDVDFVIEKAQPVWTVEPSLSKYYWGAADDPATYVPGTASFGSATAVATIDGAAFTGTYPTTGGRYAFTVTIPEAENWTELVWTKDFTVSEASVPTLNGFTGATDNYPVGGDTVLVFGNAEAAGSFTLSGPTAARILVVAGGGAGGPRIGGGGGAGGVIAERDVTLPAGTYVCRPGLGGSGTEGSYNGRGRSGKDSVLSNLTATVAYVAKGGGGGAGCGFFSATWFLPPSAGGSSGGGMPRVSGNGGNTQNKSPAPSVSGQGNKGGDGTLNGYAGGGGGAGAAGGAGTSTQPGNGGDGLLDDITGTALRYGAGGGGSRMLGAASETTISFATAGGLGGAGGGGNGATEFKNGSATDGSFYGAGGGGGAIEGNSGGTGGKGFQGVVIVRLSGSGEPPPVHVHTPTDVVAVPATCTAAGVTAGTKCAACGAILSGCEPIEKLGHDWGEWVTNTPPQIGVAGEATRTCQRTGCDAKETQVIPALKDPDAPDATTYYMIGGGDNSWQRSPTSFASSTAGAAWGWNTDPTATTALGHTVSSAYDYVLGAGQMLRPANVGVMTAETFAGHALVLAGGSFIFKSSDLGSAAFTENDRRWITIPLLVADGGDIQTTSSDARPYGLKGAISVAAGKKLVIKDYLGSNSSAGKFRDLKVEASVTGAGDIELQLGTDSASPRSSNPALSVLELAGDMSGFTGRLTGLTPADVANGGYTLKLTGKFGGTLASLPDSIAGKTLITIDLGKLTDGATKGLLVSATAIPARLKDSVTFIGVADATAADLPLMTFPAGTALNAADFTVKHADGTFGKLEVFTNADGTVTLVANHEGDAPQPPEPPPQPPSGEGIALDQIHWTNAETNWVGGDLVITWKTPGEGSLTLDAAANVRLLAVGGGGSGARNNTNGNAGGGGAGGFADFTTAFSSGTYAIEVGKGGAAVASVSSPNYSADGKAGGASSVFLGSVEVVTANGGGGGFCQVPSVSGQARKGGASGGVTTNGIAYASGFAGGFVVGANNGGGGAGAAAAGGNSNEAVGGAGGEGRTSDITGASVEYAGGGGGASGGQGQSGRTGGAGAFGGGAGGSYSANRNPQIVNAEAGRAGSGAGGGGSTTSASGAGGSGIVIVRLTIGGGDTPSVKPPSVEGGDPIVFKTDMLDSRVVNSSKAIIFPGTLKLSGNEITYGGETVKMPPYYSVTVDQTDDAWKLTLTLKADDVRPEINGQAAVPFKVESGTVTIAIDNPIDGLYYGVKTAASLTEGVFAPSGELTQGSELKDNSLTVNRDPSATTQFYRLYVTDVPNGSDSF